MVKYDPGHKCKISVHELEYQDGLAVRVYQPEGAGLFPALVDVHGGVWTNGDRTANEVMDRALAESGMVVAAVDFRQPPNDPYPAQVADVNLAIRWLKTRADDYNADPLTVGGIGGSSGGHTVLLSAMRAHHPAYNTAGFGCGRNPEIPVAGLAHRRPLRQIPVREGNGKRKNNRALRGVFRDHRRHERRVALPDTAAGRKGVVAADTHRPRDR